MNDDIHVGYWIEWGILLVFWVILLYWSNIEKVRLRSLYTKYFEMNDNSNIETGLQRQKTLTRYTLQLTQKGLGYTLREHQILFQCYGILSQIIIHILLFPLIRFYDYIIKIRIILFIVPYIFGLLYFIRNTYYDSLKFLCRNHLNDLNTREMKIFKDLKSSQYFMYKIVIFTFTIFIFSIYMVCRTNLIIYWISCDFINIILVYLLYKKYRSVKCLRVSYQSDIDLINKSLYIQTELNVSGCTDNSDNNSVISIESRKSNSVVSRKSESKKSRQKSVSKKGRQSQSKKERISSNFINIDINDDLNDSLSDFASIHSLTNKYFKNSLVLNNDKIIQTKLNEKNEDDFFRELALCIELKEYSKDDNPFQYYFNTFESCKKLEKQYLLHFLIIVGCFMGYFIRRIIMFVIDNNTQAIQFQYQSSIYTPIILEIIPFIMIWVYASITNYVEPQ